MSDFKRATRCDIKSDKSDRWRHNLVAMATAIEADWIAIRKAHERGSSYAQLEEAFGIDRKTIGRRAQRQGWLRTTSAAASVASRAILRNPEIVERTTKAIAEKTGDRVSATISELVSSVVAKSRQIIDRAHETAMTSVSARDLKDATIAFGIAHQHARLALGMDRADGLRSGQPWAQPANVIDVQTVVPAEPAKPIDV